MNSPSYCFKLGIHECRAVGNMRLRLFVMSVFFCSDSDLRLGGMVIQRHKWQCSIHVYKHINGRGNCRIPIAVMGILQLPLVTCRTINIVQCLDLQVVNNTSFLS